MRQSVVTDAWSVGKAKRGGNLSTDGQTLFSYNHPIGITIGAAKIAYDCHYSVTTARHSNGGKGVADEVVSPCPSCHNPKMTFS